LAEAGYNVVKVQETGHDYVVVNFVEGPALLDMENPSAEQSRELRVLVQHMLSRSEYVGDLNPRNLVWASTQGTWVIIDAGGTRRGLSQQEVLDRLAHKWRKVNWAYLLVKTWC
jgi:hypothetical protein